MRLFFVLPYALLIAFTLHTVLCGEDTQNQSEQQEEGTEKDKGSEEESCEEGDKDCGSKESGSAEENSSDEKDDSNDTCEIACYCHDDIQSECVVQSPKSPSAHQPKQGTLKHPHTGTDVAAGVAAGAAAAAAAGAAAHHQNKQDKPKPQQPKPKQSNTQHPDTPKSQETSQHSHAAADIAAGLATGAAAAAVARAATHQNQNKKPAPPVENNQSKPKLEQKPKQDDSKCNWCIRSNCNPGACTAKSDFNAKADADALYKAIKGLGTDEAVLTDILTHRSEEQLEEIREAYQGTGNGLDDDVRGDTSLKVKKIYTALLQTRAEFFAEELHEAFEDDNESAMIMILTSLSPCAVRQVGSAFSKMYRHKPLAKATKDAAAFKFQDFLVELIKGNRDKNGPPNTEQAIKDANALISAGPSSWFFAGKDTFIDIFTHRSYSQLREIAKQYDILKPKPGFLKDIESHSGGGKLTKGLMVMLKNVLNQPGYFADEIEGSLDKLINPFGIKDNDKLVRVLRGRCGIDLGDIRDAFPKNHNNKKLIDKLKEKSIGDYEDVLVAMMGEKNE